MQENFDRNELYMLAHAAVGVALRAEANMKLATYDAGREFLAKQAAAHRALFTKCMELAQAAAAA